MIMKKTLILFVILFYSINYYAQGRSTAYKNDSRSEIEKEADRIANQEKEQTRQAKEDSKAEEKRIKAEIKAEKRRLKEEKKKAKQENLNLNNAEITPVIEKKAEVVILRSSEETVLPEIKKALPRKKEVVKKPKAKITTDKNKVASKPVKTPENNSATKIAVSPKTIIEKSPTEQNNVVVNKLSKKEEKPIMNSRVIANKATAKTNEKKPERKIYIGARGSKYYLNSDGSKTYVK
ncbi:hypothetical protein [Flavobacterium sp.]|uniref:hypothetical protein n=1 Tax=Flavobacterium sp. TaxID=239 RepID=UPI00286DD7DA|nr:hypothetical protein [Flavobacterium sp.]